MQIFLYHYYLIFQTLTNLYEIWWLFIARLLFTSKEKIKWLKSEIFYNFDGINNLSFQIPRILLKLCWLKGDRYENNRIYIQIYALYLKIEEK